MSRYQASWPTFSIGTGDQGAGRPRRGRSGPDWFGVGACVLHLDDTECQSGSTASVCRPLTTSDLWVA